jgi:hypothetical protein
MNNLLNNKFTVKKTIPFFLLIFALSINLFAAISDPYSIPHFRVTNRVFPLKGNDIIKCEPGRNCAELDSVGAFYPGQVILRKKYEPGEYRIYKGFIDTAAFGREPPLYAFTIPRQSNAKLFMKKKFFSTEASNYSQDINEVYFDESSFYLRHFSRVYYFENGAWQFVDGLRRYPAGALDIISEPAGAQLIVNGISSLRKTPCKLENLPCGSYTIELFLPHHHFTRKEIKVVADSKIPLSFELLNDFDTVYISGRVPYGILMFPQPPVDSLFTIDTLKATTSRVNLLPGTYRIRWNGGGMYESVDTTIKVVESRVSYFDYLFQRRKGMLKVASIPFDAEICVENVPCSVGERVVELPSGKYRIEVQRHGFQNVKTSVDVIADTVTDVTVDLRMNSDRDADGFLDTMDMCPDEYGIYDGCPRRKLYHTLAIKKDEVLDYVKNDYPELGFSMIGFITKTPTNRQFNSFLSTFSAGRIGGINNYRGLTMFNTFHLMYHGFYGSVELGQWASGVRYKRSDTLYLSANNNRYAVFYDSIQGIEPVISLPSTAFSLGFHYNWSWVNVVYSIGYQWEDIVIEKIYNINEGKVEKIVFDNDWWFHQIHLESDFHADVLFVPSVYFNIKFPFGPIKRTRWHVLQVGVQMKLFPIRKKGDKKND